MQKVIIHHHFFLERAQTIGQTHLYKIFKNPFFSNSKALVHRVWSITLLQAVRSLAFCGVGVSHVNMWSLCFWQLLIMYLFHVIYTSYYFIGIPSKTSSFLFLIPERGSGQYTQNGQGLISLKCFVFFCFNIFT